MTEMTDTTRVRLLVAALEEIRARLRNPAGGAVSDVCGIITRVLNRIGETDE